MDIPLSTCHTFQSGRRGNGFLLLGLDWMCHLTKDYEMEETCRKVLNTSGDTLGSERKEISVIAVQWVQREGLIDSLDCCDISSLRHSKYDQAVSLDMMKVTTLMMTMMMMVLMMMMMMIMIMIMMMIMIMIMMTINWWWWRFMTIMQW